MTPAEQRQAVLEMCQDFADASKTCNMRVMTLVAMDIERNRLPAIIPDKPCLATVLSSLAPSPP